MLGPVMGGKFADIMVDGIVNPARLVDGKLPDKLSLKIENNGEARAHPDYHIKRPHLAGTPEGLGPRQSRVGRRFFRFHLATIPLPGGLQREPARQILRKHQMDAIVDRHNRSAAHERPT